MTFSIQTFTGGFLMTNSYLLSLNGRHALFDAPDEAADWLQRLGIKLDALFLTHQHFDHVQGAGAVVAAHGCPVYAWSPPSADLWLTTLFPTEVEPYTVTHLLAGQQSVECAGETFQLFHVPGHSPDSVCFYHAETAVCLSGDTMMQGGFGRFDFPGGSWEALSSGIRRHLLTLPENTLVLSGHGGETTIGAEKMTTWR
jgi:hydroxyacylglutathione hydrolase